MLCDVLVVGGEAPLVSVRTSKPFPKDKVFALMDALALLEVKSPIKSGDVLLENALGCGAGVVATKDVGVRI